MSQMPIVSQFRLEKILEKERFFGKGELQELIFL
jgi:hypothetical protein